MMPEIGTVPIGPLMLQTIGTAPVVATLMFGLGAWAFRSAQKSYRAWAGIGFWIIVALLIVLARLFG